MPKSDLIEAEIKWCEEHRNPDEEKYQDGFIAGLRHASMLMKSRTLYQPKACTCLQPSPSRSVPLVCMLCGGEIEISTSR